MSPMMWPNLDPAIDVLPALEPDRRSEELTSLWKRYEIFEALHHTMRIANPMSSEDLDRVVDLVDVAAGDSVIDFACGYGELLQRLARRAPIAARGVDQSPWMIRQAKSDADANGLQSAWTISDAKVYPVEPLHDVATCLGATWIWFGFNGTVRSLAERVGPGGRIAIGEMHLRDGVGAESAAESHGRLMSHDELDETFDRHGIDVLGRVRTADSSWDAYIQRTAVSAESWQREHPGDRADEYLLEQKKWVADHQRDRAVLTWSVWVGRKR